MSEELLGSFQSFSKCTASAEQKALKRLSQPENTARASRADIEFALGIVNQTNQLFSKKTGEIRKQCEASAAAFVESVERMIRVAVAAFRFLHANRSTAGFNPLALEKTISNFTTACANAHLGLRAWEGLSFLRACLLAHAEAHILAPASTKGATSSSRSALPTAGRALRKPAAKAKGAASTRAAPQKSDTAGSSEESLTTNMHRLSIGTGKANGSSSSRRTKDGAVGSIHFPVQYCNGDLAFNNLVVTLLCNFLRALSQDSASKQTAELAEDLARKNNSALDWCLRVHGIDSDSVEPFLGVCFRSYYALGTISEQHSLEIRLLGLVAYSKTKACDYRELLRYATRAALRAESSAAETQDLDGRLDAYFSGVLDLIKAQLGSLSVSPELVEFCHQAANVKQRAAGLEKALDACRLPLLSSQGDKDAHAKLVSESLSTYALVNSALRRGSLRSEAHSIALSLPLLADEALSPKARHTLAGWNSLAVCADMLRKIAKRAFGELRQPKLEPLQSDLAGVLIRVMDVAGRIYEAYISRGAAAKAESVGGTSAASLLNCNAEVYLLTIQFALQFQESSVAAQETTKSHSDRLLALCKKGKCSADFLRNHSTVFFNRGASLYQLKIYGQAAQTMDLAIGSLEQWIATSQASHASLGDALNQLCKRYEIAGSAYQSNRSFDDAAKLFGRAISWISAQFQDQVCTSIVSSQGHKVVLPPYSSVPENSAEVKRISQFVDRYVRMCAGRLVKDPREADLHASVVKYAADLPKDSVACAWLYEVEAYHWRPFSNAPSGSTSAIRTGHLTSALAIYETTSPLGYARCLIELAKLDRDGGSREACLDRLHAAMEITKELSEDSIYVLSALSECYAWRGIVGIEAGDMATDDIAACVNLWSLLHKQASAPIADSDGRSVPDCGLLRDAANTMNRTLELLMSRRMHALCSDILAVLFSISSTCERYDRSWAPTTMESLIGLGTTSLLQGHMSTAAEHFQAAASRYETGVLPVHVEVASKIAYASFQIACGDSEGGAETMMAANGIARGALELGSASRSVRTKRAAATPDTLVLLSKASHAYSVLAMKQGALADSIDFSLHSYRILCSLLKSLSIAHKKSTLEQTSSHNTQSEDDPFSDAKPDETEGAASAGDGEDDKSDAQFLAFSGNWELQRLLISNMAHLAEIYSTRGSVKEAQYFLKKGLEISAQMHAPYSESLVRLQEVDVLSRKNLWDERACA
ncbi:hypothetical protein GQ54DRAFT_142498 [Martensiomyces pterosporus]|nr:hypothetical protein GQ54DRAFT_142498 [Martensiomyces pterosporus]